MFGSILSFLLTASTASETAPIVQGYISCNRYAITISDGGARDPLSRKLLNLELPYLTTEPSDFFSSKHLVQLQVDSS